MQPRLNVLGRKHKIVSLAVEDPETKEIKHMYDKSYYEFSTDEKNYSSEDIEVPGYKESLVEVLQRFIDETREYLDQLAKDILKEVLKHDGLPFGDSHLTNVVKEYKEQMVFIEGLESMLEIVKGFRSDEKDV